MNESDTDLSNTDTDLSDMDTPGAANAGDSADAAKAADVINAVDASNTDATKAAHSTDTADALILPPLTGAAPRRLLVMLHGAGSSAGAIVTAAIAWQLKLRSAEALLLQAPFTRTSGGRYWVDPAAYPVEPHAIASAAAEARRRIAARQAALGITSSDTLLVGFSQGASVGLELAFGAAPSAAITIAYAARLYRLPQAGDRVAGRIHLLHGGADSVVPAAYGEMAYRRLRAMRANVSLDLLPEEGHAVGQVLINRGTQHAMNWLFDRGTASSPAGTAH